MQFRKKSAVLTKPRVIEAVQVTDEWFDGPHPNALHPVGLVIDPIQRRVELKHFEETMFAHTGDWIVDSSNYGGLKYPFSPDLFEQTYELADEADKLAHEADKLANKLVPLARVLEIVEAQMPTYAKRASSSMVSSTQDYWRTRRAEDKAILRLLREEFAD